MYVEKEDLILNGRWYDMTYEEAFGGLIGQLFFAFTQKHQAPLTFYGISVHDRSDGFKYFIGVESDEGLLTLPKGLYYQEHDVELALSVYERLSTELSHVKVLFEGDFKYNALPVKIEKYRYDEDTVLLETIFIPIDEQ